MLSPKNGGILPRSFAAVHGATGNVKSEGPHNSKMVVRNADGKYYVACIL